MTEKTSDRRRAILTAIEELTEQRGYPPSVREIGERVGLSSSSTVQAHLRTLEREGLVSRDPTKPRALVSIGARSKPSRSMAQSTHDFAVLPIVGKVAAGTPITATENLDGEYIVPPEYAKVPGTFMLRVVGDSMIEAAILDGDLIVVQPQQRAENGEIVVAMIDDEATVKRFFREDGRIRLQPENRTMEPIYADDVTIVGRVEGVFRRL